MKSQPCRKCRRFWRERAAELFAAAVDHLTRRDGDLETFGAELHDQVLDMEPACETSNPDEVPRGDA